MRIIGIFILLLSFLGVEAQQKGVSFREISFEEALQKAKESKKMLFVDCYTTWCVPCKVMEKEEFIKSEAVEYFETHFICVKYDMEKGEGIDLATKFKTTSYPTYLIVDAEGNEVHRVVGASKMKEFIKKVDRGLDENTALGNLDKLYKNGRLKGKYYRNYQIALSNAGRAEEGDKLLNELWLKLSDKEKSKPEYRWIYEDDKITTLDSRYFQFLEQHIDDFKKYDEKWIADYLYQKYLPTMDSYIYGYAKDRQDYNCKEIDQLMSKIKSWNISKEDVMLTLCRFGKARCENKVQDMLSVMKELEPKLSSGFYRRLMAPMHIIAKEGSKEQLSEAVAVLNNARIKSENKSEKKTLATIVEQYERQTKKGIFFEDISFEEALKLAKKTNRLLFVDAYTSWCGPCKKMDKEVFPQEKVGDYFNSKFINVRYDMEKGEGVQIAKKYGVIAYPTFLLIRPDGVLQYSVSGFKSPDDLVSAIEVGTDVANSVNVQRMKYEAGNRTKPFLHRYAKLLFNKGNPEAYKVSKDLFKYLNKRERFSSEYWYLYKNTLAVKDFEAEANFVADNIEKYYEKIGQNKVDSALSMAYRLKILYSINYDSYQLKTSEIEAMEEEIEKLDFSDKHMLLAFMKLGKIALKDDKDLFIEASEEETSSRLSAELFPYMDLTEYVFKEANKTQKKKWQMIGNKLLQQMDEGFKKSYLRGFLKKLSEE